MHAIRNNLGTRLSFAPLPLSRRLSSRADMPPAPTSKRKAPDAPISPPPVKRTLQSGTTKNAVANFFKPTSQKPKDRITWTERSPKEGSVATLLVGRYEPEQVEAKNTKRNKIAAFDLDSTLISTSSGKTHAGDATDWKWWDNQVPGRLRELYNDGYRVVILSNQGGLMLHFDANYKGPRASAQKRVSNFKQKCSSILSNLDLPTTVYAATGKDIFRKPRTGMWSELCRDYGIPEEEVDLQASIFVGDAGGRPATVMNGKQVAKDFSCSDRNLAHNVGIDYKTPEEFFLSQAPRKFARDFDLAKFPFESSTVKPLGELYEKRNKQDVVLFCGPPGAGKSTFFQRHLKGLGYHRINQDQLKTRDKCLQAAKRLLDDGESVAVDNTNADPDTRKLWIDLASRFKVPIRCVKFSTSLVVCEHNNTVRALNESMNPEGRESLPRMAFSGFTSRYKAPQMKEGFQDITEVEFEFRGSKEEYGIWGRYWT